MSQAKENLRTSVMSRGKAHSLVTRGCANTLTVATLLGPTHHTACQVRKTTKKYQPCAIVFYLQEQCKRFVAGGR